MIGHLEGARVLIYSHDTFGLGHLRRCRAIAHALVERYKRVSVLILSGSPIIGSFDYRSRVDFVRVPGVIKLRNGEYTSLSLHINTQQTLDMRASIIRHTAEIFEPHLFIVDKEPLGLRGEVLDTLTMLHERGTRLVLGLRDILDDPGLLGPEWDRKGVLHALTDLYDQLWIYGLPTICDPLEGIDLPDKVRDKAVFTGYLRRTVPTALHHGPEIEMPDEPFLLTTPGGGGDGENLVDWVLRAYEQDRGQLMRMLIVFGPFMSPEAQAGFMQRVEALDRVDALTFDPHIETMMARSAGIVAMGGYNTFCEILSFDRPAIMVPRVKPRLEQYIRASRAEHLGLVRTLNDDGIRDGATMARAIHELPGQPPPSKAMVPGLLDGLDEINRLMGRWMLENRARVPGRRRRAGG